MKRDHHSRFAARRTQRRQPELNFARRISANTEFQRADAYSVHSLRVIETKEAGRHAAFGSKLRGHSGHVPTGALNAAGGEHVRE